MTTTMTTTQVNRVMTSDLAPAIMYGPRLYSSASRDTLPVFLVPYHLCPWCYVRGDAAH